MTDTEARNVTLVGERQSFNAHRIRSFLDRNIVEYRWVEVGSSEAERLLAGVEAENREPMPVLILPDGSAVPQPSNVRLARLLGIAAPASRDLYDLVIVGGGPAGLAAAVYGSSEGLQTVVVERDAPGGQAGQSSRIANYLGFPGGLPGAELMRQATIQARDFGTEIVQPTEVASLTATENERSVLLSDHKVLNAGSIVLATGVKYRRLGAPGVDEFRGAGVYYGAGPREAEEHRDKNVFIVGAANSAGQAAVHFAGYAKKVTMLIRGDSLERSMSRYLIDEIEAIEKIEVLTETELVEAHGADCLETISLSRGGEPMGDPVAADAVFIFIGAVPNSDWLKGALACDGRGFIVSGRDLVSESDVSPRWSLERDPYLLETSSPGVFVAGDVRHGSVKRVASAVGEGAMAVQLLHEFLREQG